MMYVAIHKLVSYGDVPITFEADTDEQAEDIAWVQSVDCEEFVMGDYDLYSIVWNASEHKHELNPVIHEYAFDDIYLSEHYEIMPCDLDPLGECPKPEYARDCSKCRGWTAVEADKAAPV